MLLRVVGLSLSIALAYQGGVVRAQSSTGPGAGPDTLLPKVSPLSYTSVLRHYQGYVEQELQSWPQANDRVRQIGGWRTYAKEASATLGQ